jgi:hypothetical protein
VGLKVLGGDAVDLLAVEDMMGWAHGSLRGTGSNGRSEV